MTIWSSIWLILIASLLICHYTLIISYSFLCVYTCSFSVSFLCLCSRICVNRRLRDTNKNITWICSIIFSLSHTTVCQLLYLLPFLSYLVCVYTFLSFSVASLWRCAVSCQDIPILRNISCINARNLQRQIQTLSFASGHLCQG